MVADRYAGEAISATRTVRERYDVPPPKVAGNGSSAGNGHAATADPGRQAARSAARSRASSNR